MTTHVAGLPVFQVDPWLIGVAGLFAFVFASAFARIGASPRLMPTLLWDITRVAQMYTTVVGALAGFTAASAVFVARLGVDRPKSDELETTIGLFILAFLMLAAAAMEFANTPNAPETTIEFVRVQRLCFLIANVSLTQGICTSWLALRSLTQLLGMPGLSDALGALLLIVVVLAAFRLAQYLLDLTTACAAFCVATPLVAFGGAAAYALIARQWLPLLLPTDHLALHVALVGALVATAGFAMQSMLFTLHGFELISLRRGVSRVVEHAAVGYTAVTTSAFGLLAIAVTTA